MDRPSRYTFIVDDNNVPSARYGVPTHRASGKPFIHIIAYDKNGWEDIDNGGWIGPDDPRYKEATRKLNSIECASKDIGYRLSKGHRLHIFQET